MTLTPAEAHVHSYAMRLLMEHQLYGWQVTYDNAKGRAGLCNFKHKTIFLSRPMLKARGIDLTLLVVKHEVAHAIVGSEAGHGPVWKRMNLALGGDGQAEFEIDTIDISKIKYRYVGVCPNGHEVGVSRALTGERSCPRCSSRFDRRYIINFTDTRTGQPMIFAKRPTRNKRRRVVVSR